MESDSERLEILKSAAGISDFGYGVWAYDTWQQLNAQYFDRQLIVGGIFWGLTPHGNSLGFYSSWRNSITLHTSLVKPSGAAWGIPTLLGERFATDVLLHEMIHQYNYQIDEKSASEESHNCEAWCAQINRLILLLGIETTLKAEPIRQKRIDKKVTWYTPPDTMTRKQLARFPHCLRANSYYEVPVRELGEKAGLIGEA